MSLAKIINWVMGVRFEEEEPQPSFDDLLDLENRYPIVCQRFDCLNYGIRRKCYTFLEGCKDYVNSNQKY